MIVTPPAILKGIGVGPTKTRRAVVFSMRVPTLNSQPDQIEKDLGMKEGQVVVLHGGLSDVEQQKVVADSTQASSKIRVLVTGDIASEGVNLHGQCNQLIHSDIPWSLIRLESRLLDACAAAGPGLGREVVDRFTLLPDRGGVVLSADQAVAVGRIATSGRVRSTCSWGRPAPARPLRFASCVPRGRQRWAPGR